MTIPRSDGGYDVGYGRPPVSGRFKLGDVGNPKGRPKAEKTVGQSIQKALMTRIRIDENGKTRTLTAQEVIIRNLVHAAARRDIKAIHMLFTLLDRYQDSKETTLDPADLELEDRRIIEEHLARLQADAQTNHDASENKEVDGETDNTPDDSDGGAS